MLTHPSRTTHPTSPRPPTPRAPVCCYRHPPAGVTFEFAKVLSLYCKDFDADLGHVVLGPGCKARSPYVGFSTPLVPYDHVGNGGFVRILDDCTAIVTGFRSVRVPHRRASAPS